MRRLVWPEGSTDARLPRRKTTLQECFKLLASVQNAVSARQPTPASLGMLKHFARPFCKLSGPTCGRQTASFLLRWVPFTDMHALRRRKLRTNSTAAEKAIPPDDQGQPVEVKPRRRGRPAAAKKAATTEKESVQEQRVTQVSKGRKRKAPLVHEGPEDIPAAAPAAVMAEAPTATADIAQAVPAVVWTRETLTDAAEQLKAKDPGTASQCLHDVEAYGRA